jgi:hypothetical protein
MSEARKLAEILAADVVGYSRLAGALSPRLACGERVRERGRDGSRSREFPRLLASPLTRPLPASGERSRESAAQ